MSDFVRLIGVQKSILGEISYRVNMSGITEREQEALLKKIGGVINELNNIQTLLEAEGEKW